MPNHTLSIPSLNPITHKGMTTKILLDEHSSRVLDSYHELLERLAETGEWNVVDLEHKFTLSYGLYMPYAFRLYNLDGLECKCTVSLGFVEGLNVPATIKVSMGQERYSLVDSIYPTLEHRMSASSLVENLPAVHAEIERYFAQNACDDDFEVDELRVQDISIDMDIVKEHLLVSILTGKKLRLSNIRFSHWTGRAFVIKATNIWGDNDTVSIRLKDYEACLDKLADHLEDAMSA